VQEPQYRTGKKKIRPFSQSAQVTCRGCSRLLERVLTDFSADLPYARAMDKVVEHYGIVIAESTLRRVTMRHAGQIHKYSQGAPQGLPNALTGKQAVIVQTDGTMVPTVQSSTTAGDKRKGKSVQWQEAKVSLAHVAGSKEMSFAATLQGDVGLAGKQLGKCARRVGFGKGHRAHGLGDGAPWIARQVKKNFGQQGSYLVDFFHVCDYLSAAAQGISKEPSQQQVWLAQQKTRLKTDGLNALLNELQANLESPETPEDMAPVRCCWRYLSQRQDQLDYASAISQSLPIGSGEIESAHRYLVQKRMKLPGAWWGPENAEHMLALRVCRANNEWRGYWSTHYRYAA